MSFKITPKTAVKQESHSKVYLKLIGLEFETSRVQKAKDHYKQIYKQLSLDVTGRQWLLNEKGDKVCVQVADLYEEPKQMVRIDHDDLLTLIYSKEQFKLKEGDASIAKSEASVKALE